MNAVWANARKDEKTLIKKGKTRMSKAVIVVLLV